MPLDCEVEAALRVDADQGSRSRWAVLSVPWTVKTVAEDWRSRWMASA
ncbi:hypothetical protein [Streptomyces triculaminicus]